MTIFKMNTRRYKFTVEEVTPFKFIATRWEKEMCLEEDREVSEFETSGGACLQALDYIKEVL